MEDLQETFKSNLSEIWQRIESAGGAKETVELVSVTKRFPAQTVNAAYALGLRSFGENYSQELVAKAAEVEVHSDLKWHFIGGLQRNKVKQLSKLVSVWHTIDRISLIDEISRRCAGSQIYIQVNTTQEDQKYGCDPSEVSKLVGHAQDASIEVLGLMTMGPSDGSDPRQAFEVLLGLKDKTQVAGVSMGMSSDFELAVAMGSSCIRVGSALFGERP